AICTMRASPRQAVALFEQHLKPVRRADAKQLANALRDLDSDDFARRDEAAKVVEGFGEAAEPALRKALAGSPSLEFRRRVEQFLARFEGTELLRRSRALETLENAGDTESRRLLTALANGAPGAWITTEAQAA